MVNLNKAIYVKRIQLWTEGKPKLQFNKPYFFIQIDICKIVVLLYLQINEKIVLGPVKLLESHIVSKLKQKKNSRSLYLYASKTK